jgi:hypothetical protein
LTDALRAAEFADEDTALLINEDIENPYKELEPQNFTQRQKMNWLQGIKEDDEFEAQFVGNAQRFK